MSQLRYGFPHLVWEMLILVRASRIFGLDRRRIVLLPLVAFASFESLIALLGALQSVGGPNQTGPQGPFSVFWAYAPHFSVLAWIGVGVTIYLGRSGRGIFQKKGFDSKVYDLMVKMRGGDSRIALLRNLETPRHRFDLSGITGMDWKEVDRQLAVLEDYGLVKVYAQSGSVKLYQMTEQGKTLLRMMDDLGKKASRTEQH
jgi:DNA-binding HxlR family transcriptional regulator